MQYTTLGKPASASASPASAPAASAGSASRPARPKTKSARLIHEAVGLGINFIDTAATYGTEGVVGKALKTIPRDQVVIATKAQFRGNAIGGRPRRWSRAWTIRCA